MSGRLEHSREAASVARVYGRLRRHRLRVAQELRAARCGVWPERRPLDHHRQRPHREVQPEQAILVPPTRHPEVEGERGRRRCASHQRAHQRARHGAQGVRSDRGRSLPGRVLWRPGHLRQRARQPRGATLYGKIKYITISIFITLFHIENTIKLT